MMAGALRAMLMAQLVGSATAKLGKSEKLTKMDMTKSSVAEKLLAEVSMAEKSERLSAEQLERFQSAEMIGGKAESKFRTAVLNGGTTVREGTILKIRRQTPEELGFTDTGEAKEDGASYGANEFGESQCLDLGAKGFPLPVFRMMQDAQWDATKYFETLNAKGLAEDALQMTGPNDAILKTDCMRAHFNGRTKHIFVGDSQMMALRNAFHRRNRCPEIWWDNTSMTDTAQMAAKQRVNRAIGRLHSNTQQSPDTFAPGCKEEGIASFIHWDAYAHKDVPVDEIKKEIELIGLKPLDGDTVVVWVGSNVIKARRRMSVLLRTIDHLQPLGVRMVWDTPTFQDEAIMAATSSADFGRDPKSKVPMTYSMILQRKEKGELGSGMYKTEREFLEQGIEIPMTKRWQLTNRYRGLQCDGFHSDVRARDPLFYSQPCPGGRQAYGRSTYCSWVEPVQESVFKTCPTAYGLDDLVLQSGLYGLCAAHESPFCYSYTENLR